MSIAACWMSARICPHIAFGSRWSRSEAILLWVLADLRQPVELPVLGAQIGDVGRNPHGSAGGALHQLVRRELAPMPVEVLAQPCVQRGKLAPRHLRRDLRVRAERGGMKLRRLDVA